jgi:hypothetical protein
LVIFLQLALTLIILSVCAFAPGFFVVRGLRWNPMEKLCGAVGLSLILVWLAAWAIYVFAPGAWTPGAIGITVICFVLGIAGWPDARRMFSNRRTRLVITAFAFLLLWALIILATIRHYSGAGWTGDWLEHFQRTLVYLHHLPATTEIFGGYRIPSRPPLAHLVAAFVMAQTQDRFEIFQFVFLFLNLLLFFPCCLILPSLARPWKSGILPLAGIFALSPVLMVNASYTGVKTVAVFFVVLAVAFYLRGWKKNDPARMCMAFVAAAGGSLAHYSGLPYAVFLSLHYLVVVSWRERRWKEVAGAAVSAAVPLLAWFGWCVATFGIPTTFSSVVHASVGYGQETYQGSYLLKCIANLADAIVPHVLRDWSLVRAWGQPNTLGYIRDNAFLVYQTSLIFTMGVAGGPLVVWLLFRALRRPTTTRSFWIAFVASLVTAGFLVAGERDRFGVTHLTLISMIAIGLTFLAANFVSRRWLSLLVIAGCAIDFSFGILLQARVEHLENTSEQTPFARIQVGSVRLDPAPAGPETLSRPSGGNWFRKHQYALSKRWLQGLAIAHSDGRGLTPAQASARDALTEVVRQDDTMFGGWYKRHGGEIVFLATTSGARIGRAH